MTCNASGDPSKANTGRAAAATLSTLCQRKLASPREALIRTRRGAKAPTIHVFERGLPGVGPAGKKERPWAYACIAAATFDLAWLLHEPKAD